MRPAGACRWIPRRPCAGCPAPPISATTGQLHLGRLFRDGAGGVPQNGQLAEQYFKKAADGGNVAAMNEIGLMMYLKGRRHRQCEDRS